MNQKCQIPTSEVAQFISAEVKEGRLTPSKVLAAFDNDWRVTIDGIASFDPQGVGECDSVIEAVKLFKMEYDIEEIKIYFENKDKEKQINAGKLYEMILDIERKLHAVIKTTLVKRYGDGETGWWGQGVPEKVRLDCVKSREANCEFKEGPYSFTTFIHLSDIIKENWGLFVARFSKSRANDRPKLFSDLRRVNVIRNQVMHPVRGGLPNDDDFKFVENLQCEIGQLFNSRTTKLE
jgi:hypothetical protein